MASLNVEPEPEQEPEPEPEPESKPEAVHNASGGIRAIVLYDYEVGRYPPSTPRLFMNAVNRLKRKTKCPSSKVRS